MRNLLTLSAAILALYGCKNSKDDAVAAPQEASSTVSLTATSDIEPPVKIIKASVSPKSFASWLGHIILLGEDGSIRTTNTGFGAFTILAPAGFKDIQGSAQGDEASIVLALTEDGSLAAFREDSDDSFAALPITETHSGYASFCHDETPRLDHVYVRDLENQLVRLDFKVTATESLAVTRGDVIADDTLLCAVNQNGELTYIDGSRFFHKQSGEDFSKADRRAFNSFSPISSSEFPVALVTQTGTVGVFVVDDYTVKALSIEAGLSINGIENPEWIWSTSAPMGNTFTKGLTLVADKESNRIVMISNEYILRQLQKTAAN